MGPLPALFSLTVLMLALSLACTAGNTDLTNSSTRSESIEDGQGIALSHSRACEINTEPFTTNAKLSNLIGLCLETPKEIGQGEPVILSLELWSRDEVGQTLRLYTGQSFFGFSITTPDGMRIWKFNESHVVDILLIQDYKLAEVNTFRQSWDQRRNCPPPGQSSAPCQEDIVPPGKYLVSGFFRAYQEDPSRGGKEETVEVGPIEITISPN